MQTIFNKRILGLFILVFLSFSCTSNLDFNQTNALKLTPVVVANFANFDVQANQFVTNGVEQSYSPAVSNFDIFSDSYFNDSVTKIDLYFEVENTISRAYEIKLYFLDTNSSPIYTVTLPTIPAYTGTANVVKYPITFESTTLDLIKTAKKVGFTVSMFPGTLLTESSPGSIKLHSSATVYLTLQ
jgi:hypothetical protein